MANGTRQRILVVGASGILGRAVAAELGQRHDVVTAARNSGDVRIDLGDAASVVSAIDQVGPIDGVACAAGSVNFQPLAAIAPAGIGDSVYALGLANKLLGQVNLALAARGTLRDGGSITLIGGILADIPIVAGSSASMANAALEAFVRAAAIELPRGLRINLVSPTLLTESVPSFGPFFRGFEPVTAARAALGYSRSIEGAQTGQVFKIF
jgi:NAD(P)-dependent dehydrogenase (short-subunit alcohol dehydrogenase family)